MKKKIKLFTGLDGGITIFLSIIMLFIFALIGTLIESARVSVANTKIIQTAQISLNSVFSEYAKEVFNDYGILLLWKDENEIISEVNKYLSKNINYKNDYVQRKNDLLGIKINKIELSDVKYSINNNGEDMANQIYEYMKYRIAGDAVDLLLNKCNLLSQGKKVEEFFDKVNNCTKKFSEIEESVADIKKKVDNIKEMTKQPKEYIEELKEKLNMIRQIDKEVKIKKEQGKIDKIEIEQESVKKNQLFEEFKDIYMTYTNNKDLLNYYLTEINNKSNIYFQSVNESAELINNLYYDLDEKRESIDNEIYEILKNEVQELENQVSNQKIDAYKVRENYSYTIDYYNKMQLVSEKMTQIKNDMDGILYNNLMLSQLDSNIDYVGCFLSELEAAELSYQNVDIKDLNIHYYVQETKKSESNLLDYVEKIMNNDWLSIITDNISEKKIDSTMLPDISANSAIWSELSFSEQSIRKALMGQYILDFFYCYTDQNEIKKEDRLLDYEIEYILGGFQNDKENLSYVVKRIISIREGFNLIYLFKNADCREKAYLLAAALVGFTGMPLVIRLTQLLVMGAWAYAESLMDVKDLLNGYSVNLFKSEKDWHLSLDEIWTISDKDGKNKSSSGGFTYKDYLRFLLFIESTGKQTFGIMEMIQLNISNRYNDSFKIRQCVLGVTVKIECRVERLFTSLAFVRQLIAKQTFGFIIDTEISYCY